MSVVPHDVEYKQMNRFKIDESWIEKEYTNKMVESLKKQAEKHQRGKWLQVPVGDIFDSIFAQ